MHDFKYRIKSSKAREIKGTEDDQQGQPDNDNEGKPASDLVAHTIAGTGGINATVIDLG